MIVAGAAFVADKGLQSARRCTDALYEGRPEFLALLSPVELSTLFKNAASSELFLEPGTTIFDVVMKAKCFRTEGEVSMLLSGLS